MAEAITLTEAKLWLRVDTAADDTLITELLSVARAWCENYTRKQLLTTTHVCYFGTWNTAMELPWPPLQSVTSLQYYDTNGTLQTLATTIYAVDKTHQPGYIRLAYNQTWPALRDIANPIKVTFKSGYASIFTSVYGTDVCTCLAKTFADGDMVQLYNSGGALPGGLAAQTDYYIRDYTANTFKLALTSGGAAVDIVTDNGTGTHYIADAPPGVVPQTTKAAILLLLAHLYEHREATTEIALNEVPLGIKNLLAADTLLKVY